MNRKARRDSKFSKKSRLAVAALAAALLLANPLDMDTDTALASAADDLYVYGGGAGNGTSAGNTGGGGGGYIRFGSSYMFGGGADGLISGDTGGSIGGGSADDLYVYGGGVGKIPGDGSGDKAIVGNPPSVPDATDDSGVPSSSSNVGPIIPSAAIADPGDYVRGGSASLIDSASDMIARNVYVAGGDGVEIVSGMEYMVTAGRGGASSLQLNSLEINGELQVNSGIDLNKPEASSDASFVVNTLFANGANKQYLFTKNGTEPDNLIVSIDSLIVNGNTNIDFDGMDFSIDNITDFTLSGGDLTINNISSGIDSLLLDGANITSEYSGRSIETISSDDILDGRVNVNATGSNFAEWRILDSQGSVLDTKTSASSNIDFDDYTNPTQLQATYYSVIDNASVVVQDSTTALLNVSLKDDDGTNSYQWQVKGSWINILGGTTAQYLYKNLTPGKTYTIRALVTNAAGLTTTSDEITFTMPYGANAGGNPRTGDNALLLSLMALGIASLTTLTVLLRRRFAKDK